MSYSVIKHKYKNLRTAIVATNDYIALGYNPVFPVSSDDTYNVCFGTYKTKKEATKRQAELSEKNIKCVVHKNS